MRGNARRRLSEDREPRPERVDASGNDPSAGAYVILLIIADVIQLLGRK
jgi:hypothetical protein